MGKFNRKKIENIVREELELFEARKEPNLAQLRKMVSRPGFPEDPRHPLRKKLKDLEAKQKEKKKASRSSSSNKNVGWGASSDPTGEKMKKAQAQAAQMTNDFDDEAHKFLVSMIFQMNMMISSAIDKIIDSPTPEYAAQEWVEHWTKERDDLWNMMNSGKK
tara:strand:- start:58 stop:543 length:486 start_codon:yes stop_codon:yes gene_type:complete